MLHKLADLYEVIKIQRDFHIEQHAGFTIQIFHSSYFRRQSFALLFRDSIEPETGVSLNIFCEIELKIYIFCRKSCKFCPFRFLSNNSLPSYLALISTIRSKDWSIDSRKDFNRSQVITHSCATSDRK